MATFFMRLPDSYPVDDSITHIAKIWVPAEQLFRPAGNPAIHTSTTSPVLISGVRATYSTWLDGNIIYSYYRSLSSATDYYHPWTRLGYTYDWAPDAREVGLSELPPAAVMEKEGLDVSEMNKQLLQKIEELTLYLIAEHKKNVELEKKVTELTERCGL